MSIVSFVTNNGKPEGQNRKKSHKLTAEAITLLLDLTVAGLGNAAIIAAIRQRHQISIHTNLIGYYRKKYAEELKQRYRDEVIEARVVCPELATLAGRIGIADGIIQQELAKGEDCSSLVIAKTVGIVDTMVHRAELRAIADKETRQKVEVNERHDKILQTLELHSHVASSIRA